MMAQNCRSWAICFGFYLSDSIHIVGIGVAAPTNPVILDNSANR